MKRFLYVWQKRYNKSSISGLGAYEYSKLFWNYFIETLKTYDLINYVSDYKVIKKYLSSYECLDADNRDSCTKIVFKIPCKKLKQFNNALMEFRLNKNIEKGFYIKG